MKIGFSVTGADELQRALHQLPNAVSRRAQIRALRVGAEPIRAVAASIAPRDEQAGAPHMADHIVIAEMSARRLAAEGFHEDVAAVEVGPLAKFFYAFFQEVGTAFHAAQPFMRPGFDSQVRRALTLIRSDLWASIRQHLGRTGGRSTTGGTL